MSGHPVRTDCEGSGARRAQRGRRAAVLAVVLAGWGLRVGTWWAARDGTPLNDEITYAERAYDLLDGKGYRGSYQSWVKHPGPYLMGQLPQYVGAYQSPGYPAFLAGVFAISGRSVPAAKFVQTILGAITIWLVYWIGLKWRGHGVGITAAVLFAAYPDLVAFTHYLFTETLFIALFLGAIALLLGNGRTVGAEREPGEATGPGACRAKIPCRRSILLAGVLLGAAALTRSSSVYFVPVIMAWAGWRWRGTAWKAAIGRALLVGIGAAAAISPWTLRNYFVHGGLVLIDSSGPYNFWRGNAPQAYKSRPAPPESSYPPPFEGIPMAPVGEQSGAALVNRAKRQFGTQTPTDLQVMECATRTAVEFIRAQPDEFARRAGLKFWDLWNPMSFVLKQIRRGGYTLPPVWLERAALWTTFWAYLVVVLLAAFGVASLWRDGLTCLCLLMFAYYSAVHMATFAITRFRVPLMPMLILLAAQGLCAVCTIARRAGRRPAGGMRPPGGA